MLYDTSVLLSKVLILSANADWAPGRARHCAELRDELCKEMQSPVLEMLVL